ncbi:hypothetical protein BKA69DRAFT_425543 [Paraphysoderma sedebokerense]|nr:hypothetical protein BKA69DRAFT_1084984 [Paraphysoderma sedebokerense]KAI9141078.1 hypothetical protein BKA69DRAFT_425543 [Paraphysoderma sedebokerense]
MLTQHDSLNALFLAVPMGFFVSITLRFYAEYTTKIDTPTIAALIIRFILYQAIPSVAITAFQMQPFMWSFPHIFHWKDWFTRSILLLGTTYSFGFNAYIVLQKGSTESYKNYYRFGFAVLLLIYPALCRYRAVAHNGSVIKECATNASKQLNRHLQRELGNVERSHKRHGNFVRFTPFGYFVALTTLFNASVWYLLDSPSYGIPITYVLLSVCIYYSYRDLKRAPQIPISFSLPTLSRDSAPTQKHTELCVHPFKPNFHYMMAWGVCTIIIIVLLQLYVNTLCVFSDSLRPDCLAYYRRHAKKVPYLESLLLKLFFRSWVCLLSFVTEIFSAFAFDDGHFLHHSFLWRYMEDFVVAIGFITSTDIPLTATLLSLNFCFVILKVRCQTSTTDTIHLNRAGTNRYLNILSISRTEDSSMMLYSL